MKKAKYRPVVAESELKPLAHERSGFGSWIVVRKLPIWGRTTKPTETARGLKTVKIFKAPCYVRKIEVYRFTLQYESLKRILNKFRKTIGLQQESLKIE